MQSLAGQADSTLVSRNLMHTQQPGHGEPALALPALMIPSAS